MNSIIVRVVGHPEKTLRFYPMASSGEIKNGVCFENGKTGGWIISYTDFLKIVKLAEKERAQHGHEPDKGVLAANKSQGA